MNNTDPKNEELGFRAQERDGSFSGNNPGNET